MNKNDVLELMQRFQDSDLSRLEYNWGQGQLCLERNVSASPSEPAASAVTITPTAPVVTATQAAQAAQVNLAEPAIQAESDGQTSQATLAAEPENQPAAETITAPLVGMFYRSAAPGEPAFVETGDMVKEGDVLCIVEAMKVMNEIKAPYDCQILRIAAVDGEMVDCGKVMFEVERC